MKIHETPLKGLIIIEPNIFEDQRGYFFESFKRQRYIDAGIDSDFIQDNESMSDKGVVRGLHYQLKPYAQAKLVRVVQGVVYDVAVDLRKGSPTYGKWFGLELNDKSKNQLFIPPGFAHGFSVLSDTAIFIYKCDNIYKKESERAINAFDPKLAIDWQLKESEWKVSEKDKVAPMFDNAEMNFIF
jgi:dTDP-4-dehydrorhamnose 3,5-epimerase